MVSAAVCAVAAATGRPVESLAEASDAVEAADGARFRIATAILPGLVEAWPAPVWIVTGEPGSTVWVADLPERGWQRLDSAEGLEALFRVRDELPAATRAQLIAINLGPGGAERVMLSDEHVEGALAELAGGVDDEERRLVAREGDRPGEWSIEFLGVLLQRDPAGTFVTTASRWEAELTAGGLRWSRDELISQAVLARYGGPAELFEHDTGST
jgi:hypothetical protein